MNEINKLPDNIKNYILTDGKDLADGYIRFLNSDKIDEISEILKKSQIWNNGVPFAITVFGDVVAWEDNYIVLYKFTDEDYTIILSGSEFFFTNLQDKTYQQDFFDIELYHEAVKRLGKISREQCYIFEPIPKLGGAREVKYLNIGEFKNYIYILL